MPFGVSGRQSPFCIFPLSLSSSFYFLSFSKQKSEGDNLLQIMTVYETVVNLVFTDLPSPRMMIQGFQWCFLVIVIITVYLFSSSQHQDKSALFFSWSCTLTDAATPYFIWISFFYVTLFHNWKFFWPSLTAVSFFFRFFFLSYWLAWLICREKEIESI